MEITGDVILIVDDGKTLTYEVESYEPTLSGKWKVIPRRVYILKHKIKFWHKLPKVDDTVRFIVDSQTHLVLSYSIFKD